MDRYQRVEKPRPESTINENEIRITAQGLIRNYINYANALLQEKRVGEIVLKAMGHAINKTVAVAEIVKKRIPGLHQDTSISSIRITDVWEPIEEGLLPLETTRHVSMISITLSIKELNPNSPGYQAAVFGEQPKQLTRTQPPQIQKPQQQHQQYQPQFQQQQPRHNQYHQQPRQQQQQPPRQHQYQHQPPQQYQSYQQHRNTTAPNAGVNEDSYLRGRGRGRGRSWGGRGYNGYNTNTYNNNQENGDYNYYGNRGGRGRGWGNRGGSGYERGRGSGRGGGYYSRGRGRMGGGGGNGGHHS